MISQVHSVQLSPVNIPHEDESLISRLRKWQYVRQPSVSTNEEALHFCLLHKKRFTSTEERTARSVIQSHISASLVSWLHESIHSNGWVPASRDCIIGHDCLGRWVANKGREMVRMSAKSGKGRCCPMAILKLSSGISGLEALAVLVVNRSRARRTPKQTPSLRMRQVGYVCGEECHENPSWDQDHARTFTLSSPVREN